MTDYKNVFNGDVWSPIILRIGEPPITLADIYNPYYPCKVMWRCKASRKKFKK